MNTKEFNINRLMNASPYINQISDETYDALLDFYIDTGATLENINVDNDIINGITECSYKDFKKEFTEDDMSILYKDEEEDFVVYWN